MGTIAKYVLLLGFASCFGLFSCSIGASINYEIIQIHGASWASNLTSSYIMSGSSSESALSPELLLPVSDGDLLYLLSKDDQEFFYRYSRRDGNKLVVTFDSLNAGSVRMNGYLNSLELSKDPSTWDRFMELTEAQIKQLSSLRISDSIGADRLSLLQQHSSSLKGVGLLLENGSHANFLGEILSICRPEWLVSEGCVKSPEPEYCAFLSDLELLWIQGQIHSTSELIPFCSNLESLIISDWEPLPQELLSLSKMRGLHTITLAECGLSDLSNIEFPSSLRRLQIIACEALTQMKGIENLRKLSGISFTGCKNIEEITQINGFRSLAWCAFPGNLSQTDFESILGSFPKLEFVELIGCENIDHLSPLKELSELSILILDLPPEKLEELNALNKLDLLILPQDLFDENPEWISTLRTSLPNTRVIPGSGLCLGSGWILLLLPFVVLIRVLFPYRRS